MMNTIQVGGKSYRVNHRAEIAEYPHLQASEPDTVAYVFADLAGRCYLIRELRNGAHSKPVRL